MALTEIKQAGLDDEAVNEAKLQISNAGTNGQFLQKSSNTGGLTWATATSTTINNNANDRLITGSASANTLEAEAKLLFVNQEYLRIDGAEGENAILQLTADEGDDNADSWRVQSLAAGGLDFSDYSAGSWTQRVLIDSSGRLLVGHSTSQTIGGGHSGIQVNGSHVEIAAARHSNNASGPYFSLGKSRSGSSPGATVVQDGDALGYIQFAGADGTDIDSLAASIGVRVDGTPGSNDMPGRLMFNTTADGATSPTERMRIDSSGNVIVGGDTAGFQSKLTTGAGSSDEAITILSGTSSTGSLYFADGTAASDVRYRGWVQYIHTSDYLTLGTAATEALRVDSSQNVLIGTTTALAEFTVKGGGTVAAFEGTGGSSGVMITDADASKNLFLINDDGVFSVQTSGSSYANKLNITEAGSVTLPKQPSFRATNIAGATGSVTLTSEDQVFHVADYDVGSNYDTSNGRFTAPVAGKYFFWAYIIYNDSGATTQSVHWKKNGSRVIDMHFCSNGGQWDGATYAGTLDMAASDYMTFNHSACACHGGSWSHIGGWLLH
jgi:hypothetical protein